MSQQRQRRRVILLGLWAQSPRSLTTAAFCSHQMTLDDFPTINLVQNSSPLLLLLLRMLYLRCYRHRLELISPPRRPPTLRSCLPTLQRHLHHLRLPPLLLLPTPTLHLHRPPLPHPAAQGFPRCATVTRTTILLHLPKGICPVITCAFAFRRHWCQPRSIPLRTRHFYYSRKRSCRDISYRPYSHHPR